MAVSLFLLGLGVISLVINESNIRGSVLKLSFPAVFEQSLFMVVGVVSTAFVGNISNEAVTSVGMINSVFNFVMALFVALSTGSTVLVARLIGEEDYGKAREVVKQSVVMAVLSSLGISVLCYLFSEQILHLFFGNTSTEDYASLMNSIHLAGIYFRITLFTLPLTLINIIISGSLRGAGDTMKPAVIAVLVNFVNLTLNVVLIHGMHFGQLQLDGFGIYGAAWAVSISRGIGGILAILALYLTKNIIRLNIKDKISMQMQIFYRILKIGLPAALEQFIMQGGFLILQVVIAGMGTIAMAVYQIVMSINSMSFIPGWGFGVASTTLVGQGLGARKPQYAEKSGWETLKIAMLVSVILTAIIFIFAENLMDLFSNDPDVIQKGMLAVRIFSLSQPFLTVVVVFSGALRGAGDIYYVTITTMIGIWGFRLGLTYFLNAAFGFGIMGVWVAYCMDFFIRSIMYMIRFRRGRWKNIII